MIKELQRLLCATCLLGALPFALPASATTISDDFEDMNLNGWTQSNSGGAATFDVVFRNNSHQAHVGHRSATATGDQSSLSMAFGYVATDLVSFDMEAVGVFGQSAAGSRDGLAGVNVTFFDQFQSLGSAGLFNASNSPMSPLLGRNDTEIDTLQRSYSATMSQWAALAGLSSADPIVEMRVSFVARGFFGRCGIVACARSGGDVWFDNFVVPEPSTFGLVSLGLCVIGLRARPRHGS